MTYIITIPQRHTFRQFCSMYGIDDLESRLEVIWGRWFLHQSKASIWLPINPQW